MRHHGNAHFLRGIAGELVERGQVVRIFGLPVLGSALAAMGGKAAACGS